MTNTKYKLSSIDKAQITAAARKALMTADANYYAWPTEQQERFRTTMDRASRKKVRRVLLDSLLDEAALKKIRWRHFLSDCKPLMKNYSMAMRQLEQEVKKAKVFLTENHQAIQAIQANFDPNVIKLRKKRKIIMTAGALDDLDKMSSEDDPQE